MTKGRNIRGLLYYRNGEEKCRAPRSKGGWRVHLIQQAHIQIYLNKTKLLFEFYFPTWSPAGGGDDGGNDNTNFHCKIYPNS
jgi:hypothetical protein